MNFTWKKMVAAFVLGGVVGAAGVYVGGPHYLHRHGGHWGHGKFQGRLLERFSSELKLSPEQKTQVGAILEEKRRKIEALRAEIQPRFKEIRTSTAAEIRPLLTSEQQQKFDVMNAKWEEKAKRFCWGKKEDEK